jgi:hypothetical protein
MAAIPRDRPELNPDERVSADLKYGVGSKTPKKTKKELSKAVNKHMTCCRKHRQE